MKKNMLLFVALSIVTPIAFMQCTSSTTTNSQTTDRNDTTMPLKAMEQKATDIPVYTIQIPITEPVPINKPVPDAKPVPVTEPVSVAKPVPITEPDPIVKTVAIDKPIDAPALLKSSRFSLKLLKATIQGSSTLHDWESDVTQIEGKGTILTKDKELATIQNVEIKIAVKGIKSKEGSKMDDKTYEAFNSDENPYITYTFGRAIVKISASNFVTIDAAGNLSMAGVSKPMSLSATGKELSNGDLQLTVTKRIKMTDYGMEPPVMFFGTIKVGDVITVTFDFELVKLPKQTILSEIDN